MKEGEKFYIEEIVNGYVSNRDENSPITNLGLKFYREKTYLKENFVTNYDVQTLDGPPIQGSIFFLKDKNNELEDTICINHDLNDLKNISDALINLMPSASMTQSLGLVANENTDFEKNEEDHEEERAVEGLLVKFLYFDQYFSTYSSNSYILTSIFLFTRQILIF